MTLNIKKSLRSKLLISFIVVALIPFILLLGYIVFLSETNIVKQTLKAQSAQAHHIISMIDTQLLFLENRIDFLTSLDLMDDVLVDDIDKRVSILLTKNVKGNFNALSLYVLNEDKMIIAASDTKKLQKRFKIFNPVHHNKFLSNEYLYLCRTLYASFDQKKVIGYLVLQYNLNDLDRYLLHQEGIHTYITNNTDKVRVGDITDLKFKIDKRKTSLITDAHVIVYRELHYDLSKYYLVYAVDKELALKFLNDFVRFILLSALVLLIAIIIIAFYFSKTIVKPIEKLTKITKEITHKQVYTAQLSIDTEDEIALLTYSFNEMLQTTSKALNKLEYENQHRLKRFIQLLDVFNTIIQTNSENECIEITIDRIKKITNKEDLAFTTVQSENTIDLYRTNFQTNTKQYFGSISLKLDTIRDNNEHKFYTSIATMMMLQIDRIYLIKHTIAVSEAKSSFISHMSHELRTPLNSIIGSSQYLLGYEKLTDDQQDSVANIESSAHYLLEMINDILDISKIEAGKMEVNKESLNIVELIKNTYIMLEPLVEEKKLALTFEYSHLTIYEYYTDRRLLQQIVINLLSNAIKFTKEGSIKIELFNNKNSLYIKIKDSGIGITSENLTLLFNDFTQVSTLMDKTQKGTGLGLSLSRKMASLIDGEILLNSEGLGRGVEAIIKLKIFKI